MLHSKRYYEPFSPPVQLINHRRFAHVHQSELAISTILFLVPVDCFLDKVRIDGYQIETLTVFGNISYFKLANVSQSTNTHVNSVEGSYESSSDYCGIGEID